MPPIQDGATPINGPSLPKAMVHFFSSCLTSYENRLDDLVGFNAEKINANREEFDELAAPYDQTEWLYLLFFCLFSSTLGPFPRLTGHFDPFGYTPFFRGISYSSVGNFHTESFLSISFLKKKPPGRK